MNRPTMSLLHAIACAMACTACGGGAKGTVKDYLSQANCDDRGRFILNPEVNGSALVDYYKTK